MDACSGQHPLDRGFDYFFGFNGCCTTYFDATNFYRNREKAKPEGYSTDQFTDGGAALPPRRQKGRAVLPLPALQRRPRALRQTRAGQISDRFHTGSKRIDNFYAYLKPPMRASRASGASLAERGQENNTLILLISDNGASGTRPIPSNAPFLGFKGQVWQGGVRVPMVVWGPGSAWPPGRSAASLSSPWTSCRRRWPLPASIFPPATRWTAAVCCRCCDGRQKQPVHENLFWAGQLAQKWVNKRRCRRPDRAAGLGDAQGPLDAALLVATSTATSFTTWKPTGASATTSSADHPDIVRALKADYAQWFKGTQKPMAWGEEYWKMLAPTA